MQAIASNDLRLGILGGGQLGKMLIEAASDWNIQCFVLDPDPNCSCAHLAYHFECGDFKDYATVYAFGQIIDKITIEIEHVNVDALIQLEKEGKSIYPSPTALKIIQNKGKQKEFYIKNNLPTALYKTFQSKHELKQNIEKGFVKYPFVQKSCEAGYDGKGVSVIRGADELKFLLEGEHIIEEYIPFEKELAVIVARDSEGNIKCFPPVEMEFHPTANLVEFLLAPALISEIQKELTQKIAIETIEAFGIIGILAVELFLTKDNKILINEVAPRAHNSGHHTIEANYTSQYQQLLRTIFNIPLGSTQSRAIAVMVNLLGSENFTGNAKYEGFQDCLDKDGVYIHLYGKQITKPYRKMGHATILSNSVLEAKEKAHFIKNTLKIIA